MRPDDFEAEVTAFLDAEAARVALVAGIPTAGQIVDRVGRRRSAPIRQWTRGLRLGALAGVAVALLVGALWLAGSAPPSVPASPEPATPSPRTTPDLMADVLAHGSIAIAVRPDFPQAMTVGLEGFDLDVARELADRLGLRLDVAMRPVGSMWEPGVGSKDVDVALPSDGRAYADEASFLASEPYYYWPVRVVVAEGSSVQVLGDVDGRAICVVVGSPGEAWLTGLLDAAGSDAPVTPPADATVRREATDVDCLSALAAGSVDALVTATLSDADFATRALRAIGPPVLTDRRSVVARRSGPDPAALIDAVDDALSGMRSDGTLLGFSRNRFGGNDLTQPPTP